MHAARVLGLGLALVAPVAAIAACIGDDAATVAATDGGLASETAPPAPNDGAADVAVDAGPACDRSLPFSSLDELTELNSMGSVGNFTPRLTADGLQLFFSRALTGLDFVLYRTKRASRSAAFEAPTEVLGLAHPVNEYDSHPFPLPDGSAIYFQRSLGTTRDIFFAAMSGSGFTTPVAVTGLSAPAVNERAPYLATDGTMWLELEVPDGGTGRRIATAPQSRADAFGTTTLVELSTPASADDKNPVISSDGLTLYFASTRTPNTGGSDIWVAHRASASSAWDPPQPVTFLSSAVDEEPSWISPDDCELYFGRIVGSAYHIFRARRR